MKANQGLHGFRGRAGRGVVAVLVATAFLPMMLASGAAWAQQPAPATTTAAANELDPKAIEALKKMGAFLRTLRSFAVHAETTKDEVLESGQKVQFSSTLAVQARPPDRLRIDVTSDRKNRQYYYDGKTVTQYAPRVNYYASFAAPGTIRRTLEVAADKYDLELPLADLFYWGTDQSGIDDIKSAIDLGLSRVGGVECEHYAFRQEGADWQLWIERGKNPLPRKLVITTVDEPSEPQYTALLRWNLNARVSDKAFVFVPPKGAERVTMAPAPEAK